MAITEWFPRNASGATLEADLENLAELLHAAVHAGASIGFVLPFPIDEARGFWRERVLPGALAGMRRMLVARRHDRIVGTVQLGLDTMPNQGHRAEVMKLLVHPEARRQGIARALMTQVEGVAQSAGRTLLTLDTSNDLAEHLYLSMGYVRAGVIPRYALKATSPELEATTIMYKELPI